MRRRTIRSVPLRRQSSRQNRHEPLLSSWKELACGRPGT